MWKQNRLGGYEQTPVKTGTKKQKNPIRSGWYSHPDSGETVWYDSKTNQFRDKVGGPARDLLSIGWRFTGGKDAADLVGMTIKGAKKVIPAVYKADKAKREEKGKMVDKTLTDTGKLLNRLLVNKTDPGFTDVKDKTGITKGKKEVIKDMEILGKEASTPTPKAENTANNSKKKNEELAIKKKNNPFADVGYE